MDETLAELIYQWRTGSRAFVIRKLVDMPTSAEAAYYAAQLAIAIMDPLDLFDALAGARAGRAPTLLTAPTRVRKAPARPTQRKTLKVRYRPTEAKPTPTPTAATRQFSLSELPNAASDGSVDVVMDDETTVMDPRPPKRP